MKLAFGADHAGFQLKDHLVAYARSLGHDVRDFGTNGPASVDYPDFAVAVANEVVAGRVDLGVVICSNGVGISITANKVVGVHAALCHTSWGSARARQHVDANVLALGGLEIGTAIAEEILLAFLTNEFEGGRHQRRVDKLMDVERTGIAAELRS